MNIDLFMTLPNVQKLVTDGGRHTARGEQHELMTHIELFDTHWFVILLHGSSIEHRIAGAHTLIFVNVR